ncbi:MAG TPA: hypothetical protein VMP01_11275 [Pirellulaceae bacterium]|nr:hypothetical protein [Pirellulaceae bacterium]
MRLSATAAIGTVAIGMLVFPASLEAQYRGRGGFDPAEMIRNMDANKNGQIEPAEMASNRSAFFVRAAAQRAGLDLTKPLPVDKLVEAMQRPRDERSRDGDRREGDRGRDDRRRDDDRRSDRDRNSPATPPVAASPGIATFGAPPASTPAATTFGSSSLTQKFDPRAVAYAEQLLSDLDKNNDGYIDSQEWQAGSWNRDNPPESSDLNKDNRLSKDELSIRMSKRLRLPLPSDTSTAGSSAGNSDQVRRYAEGMMRLYDKNRDGKLKREEWLEMPPQHHSADTDGDGTITMDELAVKLTTYAGVSSSTSSGSAFSAQGSSTGTVRRFRTPAERLPAGLPSWFMEKDANQDGQVMMSEFASRWSNETAAEFSRFDLNGDGIITAKECLKAESLK